MVKQNKKQKKNMKQCHSFEIITPAKAKLFLSNNLNNRKIKPGLVDKLTEDMKAGKYNEDIAVPIIFDIHGNVINGQHRLHAVINSGKAQRFSVVRNVPESANLIIDNASNQSIRTDADAFSFKYGKEYSQFSRITSKILLWESKRSRINTRIERPSVGECMKFFDKNKDTLIEINEWSKDLRKPPFDFPSTEVTTRQNVVAFIFFCLQNDNKKAELYIYDFFEKFFAGVKDTTKATKWLRHTFRYWNNKGIYTASHIKEQQIMMAILDYRNNKAVSKRYVNVENPFKKQDVFA